jgi:hypothetical protein
VPDYQGSRQSDSNRRPADYKSAALPAELCRRLRGKILSHAASASPFLYAFSIRQGLTPLAASFGHDRSTRALIRIVLALLQRRNGSQLGAAAGFVRAMLEGWESVYERVRVVATRESRRAFFCVPWGLHVVRSGKSLVRNISSLGFWRVSPAPVWPSPRAGHLRHLFSS